MYIRQHHTPGQVELEFEAVALEVYGKPTWQAEVISPDGQTRNVSLSETGKGTLSICDPELWWPNRLGEQPLYQVRVQLFWMENSVISGNENWASKYDGKERKR